MGFPIIKPSEGTNGFGRNNLLLSFRLNDPIPDHETWRNDTQGDATIRWWNDTVSIPSDFWYHASSFIRSQEEMLDYLGISNKKRLMIVVKLYCSKYNMKDSCSKYFPTSSLHNPAVRCTSDETRRCEIWLNFFYLRRMRREKERQKMMEVIYECTSWFVRELEQFDILSANVPTMIYAVIPVTIIGNIYDIIFYY